MEQPQQTRADEIRADLAQLGITEKDVSDAIAWARKEPKTGGIWAALRRAPRVDLKLKRPFVKPRKIDL